MKRVLFLLPLITLLGLGTGWAGATSSPQAVVEDTSQQMLNALRDNRDALNKSPDKIYDLVADIVLPHFDFERMSQWVLGKHWRSASPEQRRRFTDEFRTLLVRSYARALLEFGVDGKVQVLSASMQEGKNAIVRSEARPGTGAPVAINYRMHPRDGGWRVYDVSVDGVSLVTNYRNSLGSDINTQGLEAVIAKLSKHNAKSQR